MKHIMELGNGTIEMAAISCHTQGKDLFVYEVPALVFNIMGGNTDVEDTDEFIIGEDTIFAPFENSKDIERLIVRARGLVEGCEVELLNNVVVRIVKQEAVGVFVGYLEQLARITYQENLPKRVDVDTSESEEEQ